MKIRIVANKPADENCSDISHLIGKEFEVEVLENGNAMIGNMTIFEGEYEIVNEQEDITHDAESTDNTII